MKNEKLKKIDSKYICVFICFIWDVFLAFMKPIYTLSPDSATYQIEGLSSLFDGHRLPLYRLINFLFFKILGNNYEYASVAVVVFQTAISVLTVLLIYDILKTLLFSNKLTIVFSIIYGIVVGAFGYNEHILTESLAVSFMTLLIWLIVKALTSNRTKYFVFLPIVSLLSVLLRPSFIFLFPLLGLFYIIYFVCHRKQALYGLVSLFVALLCVFAVCNIHKNKCGSFCLSDVSYQNEMGIIISGDYYLCDGYSDITDFIETNIINSDSEDKCYYFRYIANNFGPDKTIEYMNECKKIHFKQMIRDSIEYTLYPYSDSFIVKNASKMNLKMQMLFCAIRFCLFPFTYGGVAFLTVILLVDSIIRSFKEKKIKYIELGIIGCIWCIYILSFVTLYEAPAQRIAVHLIPCVIVMTGILMERIVQIISSDRKNKQEL